MDERSHDQRPERRAAVRRFRLMYMVVEPVIEQADATEAERAAPTPAPEGGDPRAERRPAR
jgi:hypothetical protein